MIGRLLVFLASLLAAVSAGAGASACSIRERTTADWLELQSSATAIFAGRVDRLEPMPAEEEAEIRGGEPRIAGFFVGDRMGYAAIAPVRAFKGAMAPLSERYVSGSFCGRPGWDPDVGDTVLVLITADGRPFIFDADDDLGANLRNLMSDYW